MFRENIFFICKGFLEKCPVDNKENQCTIFLEKKVFGAYYEKDFSHAKKFYR